MSNMINDSTTLSVSFGKQAEINDQPPPPLQVDDERTPLPAGWVEEKDALSGAFFYMNVEKGETTWVRPVVAIEATKTATASKNAGIETDTVKAENEIGTGDEYVLPEGWVEMKDAFSGESYYTDPNGDTSWKRPKM